MHLVLGRNVAQEEFGVDFVGRGDGCGHQRKEGVDDVITREFDVGNFFGTIDACARHFCATLISSRKGRREMTDERTAESTSEDFGFVAHKDFHTSALEGIDDTGTEIGNLFAGVGVFGIGVADGGLFVFGEKLEEELSGFFGSEDAEFVGVFDIHNFIADVVGSFYEKDEGVTGKLERISFVYSLWRVVIFHLWDAEGTEDVGKGFAFGVEESEFGMRGEGGREGIFGNGSEGAIRHHESSGTTAVELVGEEAEGVGIAIEMGDVVPHLERKLVAKMESFAFGKKGTNGGFSFVSERGITQIVCQTSGTDDGTDAFEGGNVFSSVAWDEQARNVSSQGASYAGNFEGMGETIVHKDTAGEGKNLRFVLQPAEGRGEDESVVVALKLSALFVGRTLGVLLSPTRRGDELIPFHIANIGVLAK